MNHPPAGDPRNSFLSFFFITLGLELSDTKVYEPLCSPLSGTRVKVHPFRRASCICSGRCVPKRETLVERVERVWVARVSVRG